MNKYEHIYRKILFLSLLCLNTNVINAQVKNASSFSFINNLISSNDPQIISISSNVIASSDNYHAIGFGAKIIYGNNSVLDGESYKTDSKEKREKYSGFLIDSIDSNNNNDVNDVTIKDLTMQNFKDKTIYTIGKAKLDLRGSIKFQNNNGYNGGGAISANYGSDINFNGISAIFKNNRTTSNNGGGAICANNASINFNGSDVEFIGNMASDKNGCGGAICIYGESVAAFGERVEFSNNTSDFDGGAIYATHGSNVTIKGRAEFIGNNAKSDGGAIYISDNSILNIETFNYMASRFKENKARDKSNAIHLAMDALLNFNNNGVNAVVDMDDAVTSEKMSEAIVNINGTGQFNLTSKEKSIIPNLNINENSIFNIGSNTSLQITEKLKIGKDAKFNIGNNKKDNIIYVKDYIQEGTLSFDIFADIIDAEYCKSDCIISNGKVFLGADSKLKIFTNGIPINDGIERKYVLMSYTNLKGKFNKKNVIFMDIDLMEEDINYDITYKDNKIIFILNPYTISKTSNIYNFFR